MEGASSGLAGNLDDILPKKVQLILAWNPPQLRTEEVLKANLYLPTQAPPDTALSALKTTTATAASSRKPAFYDKHLAPHLILERVVYFDTLVSTMANTVDQAVRDAVAKHPLPEDTESLQSEMAIIRQQEHLPVTMYHELGVAEDYLTRTAHNCRPIASTLALHPSCGYWESMLDWRLDGKLGRWAIADGVLRLSPDVFSNYKLKEAMLKHEDDWKKGILDRLAFRATALAVWEMKSLTVGTEPVMKEIAEMGLTHAKFPWKKCDPSTCEHSKQLLKGMKESEQRYDAGFDPRSPPWTLPIIPSASFADSRPIPLRESPSRRSASTQRGTTAGLSYKEPSMSPVEDGEGERRKRGRSDPDVLEDKRPPPKKRKKSKVDLGDKSFEPPPGARREVNAHSYLQQTWAEAVRNNCTIMVMHSGNHEIIGIRHRETQTLYISHVIEPHACSNPAYGKIQVGIYIAAIQDTIDRAKQDIEAGKETDPLADVRLKSREANRDVDPDDHSPKGPPKSNSRKRGRGSGSKGKGKGRYEGNAKRHASGKVVDDQALLADAARQSHLCLGFFYDIYDSPYPASFRRVRDEPKEALGPAEPPTPPLSPGRETTPPSAPSIHITVHSELQPGSTGIVHIGTMAVDPSGPTAKVAVKLAFSRDEKSRLTQEHRMYSHLHSRDVQGIPRVIGLFVDEEPLLGAEGPHALVMTYAGVSLFHRHMLASDSAKDSLLATLESIHRANILHGDIRLPNLCTTPSGEAFIVDFSHATESRSRKEKAREIRELTHILEMDAPAKPAAEDEEKPVLRRSTRIKELERKKKVEPKNEQVKHGKPTRRK